MKRSHLARSYFRYARQHGIFYHSLKVSAVVGSILMLINHGDKLFDQAIESFDYLKICVTYLVPFIVSTYASINSAAKYNREGIHHD